MKKKIILFLVLIVVLLLIFAIVQCVLMLSNYKEVSKREMLSNTNLIESDNKEELLENVISAIKLSPSNTRLLENKKIIEQFINDTPQKKDIS